MLEIKEHKESKIILILDSLETSYSADVYYISLHPNLSKISDVINHLTMCWNNIFLNIMSSTIYLPFDLSDEYLGCLRIIKNDKGRLLIQYGYIMNVFGYEIDISTLYVESKSDLDFIADSREISFTEQDFKTAIHSNFLKS